ncbi:hypothetical protein EU545_02460 [Candidatus Thorarchaeota archaeon]|nr:MAG: hypothetical protein EU545_02460 [Candidatus Thorarchaeota archaeon]
MPITDFPAVIQIKDPIHGYVSLSAVEKDIMDLRISQRLRYIREPAGLSLVYPGADISLMGRTLGFMHMTEIFFEHLDGGLDEVQNGRIAALLLMLACGPWGNVIREYLEVRGTDRKKLASMIVELTPVGEKIEANGMDRKEVISLVAKGVPLKSLHMDLTSCSINPELIDDLWRDSYFAGVEYAQLEFRRLFNATRLAKNKLAVERTSLFTLESYLSAAANMFDAVYFHKTVRAAELMLLRVLDVAGSQILPMPDEEPDRFFLCDDLTFMHQLLNLESDATEEMKEANRIYGDFNKRYLIKLVSSRAISDPAFLAKLGTADGLYEIESEIAEDADIDPRNVYIDFPDRTSVTFYPGRFNLDEIALFERGSSGYEFWRVSDMSPIARSFSRIMKPVRVYTSRGYRSKVKKSADQILESVDASGER